MRFQFAAVALAATLASCANTSAPVSQPQFAFAGHWLGTAFIADPRNFELKIATKGSTATGTFGYGEYSDVNKTELSAIKGTINGTVTADTFNLVVTNLTGYAPIPANCVIQITGYAERRNDSLAIRAIPSKECPTPVIYPGVYFPSTGIDGLLHRVSTP